MAVNFLTLRSAVANDIAVQHLTYSTMVGHPTASHQTVQAIIASSIMTMGHVGIGTTTPISGTALNVIGSTMISGNTSIVGTATGTALVINNNQTGVSDAFSLMMTNKQTPPSRLMFIQKAIGNGAYNNIVQGGDHILLSYDQNSGVSGANGIVIGGWNQTAGLRIGTTSSAFNGDLTANSGLTGSEVYTNGWFRVNGGGGLYWQTYGRGIYSADSAGATYGNVSVYGTGLNTWNGYDINGRYTFMANGDTVGIHDKNNSWVWYNVNGTMTIPKALNVTGTLHSNGVPITLTQVAQGSGGDYWWQNWGSPAGYYKLPGGMTFQWGAWTTSDGSYNYIRYPIPFTTVFGVQATKTGATSGNAVNVFGVTNATCNIDSAYGSSGKSYIYWFAYGIV